jgi:NAD(P)H-dependent FMN reductase
MSSMKLLGVAGSLRGSSHNRRLLRAAASLLPPEVQFTEYDGLKLIGRWTAGESQRRTEDVASH